MELATIELKLLGNPQNTVIKHNVTPSELSVYAAMHGEDCVEGVQITDIDKTRTVREEMDRLRMIFSTEDSAKMLSKLFPGISPPLVVTFSALGYQNFNQGLGQSDAADRPPQPNNEAEAAIQAKIRDEAAKREADLAANQQPPVHQHEVEQLDNNGASEAGTLDLADDSLEPPQQQDQGQ